MRRLQKITLRSMVETIIPHHPIARMPGLASGIVTDDGNVKITDDEIREREDRARYPRPTGCRPAAL
jgi:hypothetical protein